MLYRGYKYELLPYMVINSIYLGVLIVPPVRCGVEAMSEDIENVTLLFTGEARHCITLGSNEQCALQCGGVGVNSTLQCGGVGVNPPSTQW